MHDMNRAIHGIHDACMNLVDEKVLQTWRRASTAACTAAAAATAAACSCATLSASAAAAASAVALATAASLAVSVAQVVYRMQCRH
jgi:hypothetical protein